MAPPPARDTESPQRTYGNWRRGVGAGLFGLGPVATLVMFAIALLTVLMLAVSIIAALVTALLGLCILGPLAFRFNGRTGLQAIAARIAWWRGRSRRQHVYLSGVASRATGSHQLPGILARSEVYEVETGRAGRIGVVVVPQSRHYTVTLRCSPEGIDLVDQSAVDARVAHLAGWLAALCREPGLVQAAVTVETTPDPGHLLAAEVHGNMADDAPDLARQVLGEVVRHYPAGAATVETLVSLTYTVPPGRRGLSHEDMCREVAARLPHLHSGLSAAGAGGVHPVSPRSLAAAVRAAYDPAVAHDLSGDHSLDVTWENAGPVAARESWDSYRHDSGFSRTWGMVEAPRGVTFSNTFSRLTDPDPELMRKRVSLIYRPYSPAESARLVEADKRDARFNATKKARPTARDLVDLGSAEQAAQEEAAGAGVVRFTLLVTATVASADELEQADRIIASRAAEARLSLRPMYGAQAATFAAGLPAGVVLPVHASVPF
ncbi:SCO6880 family protein [Micromonospora sp. DT43]|uniref:SCO6880 family protein n=1 Tax=Micromonospora sp. DT43 TaxID=3393440 RepID=UPI003CF56A37